MSPEAPHAAPLAGSQKSKARRSGSQASRSPVDRTHPSSAKIASAAMAGPRLPRLPKGERGGIELLLVHTVEHLGKQGEVVEVKRGYAFNFLLPQGLATIATDHHKRHDRGQRQRRRAPLRFRWSHGDFAFAQTARPDGVARADHSAGTAQGGGPLHRAGATLCRSGRRSEGVGCAFQRRWRFKVGVKNKRKLDWSESVSSTVVVPCR